MDSGLQCLPDCVIQAGGKSRFLPAGRQDRYSPNLGIDKSPNLELNLTSQKIYEFSGLTTPFFHTIPFSLFLYTNSLPLQIALSPHSPFAPSHHRLFAPSPHRLFALLPHCPFPLSPHRPFPLPQFSLKKPNFYINPSHVHKKKSLRSHKKPIRSHIFPQRSHIYFISAFVMLYFYVTINQIIF